MSMKAKYYATQVISNIEDKVANREEVEPAYYETKEYFNSFGLSMIVTECSTRQLNMLKTG